VIETELAIVAFVDDPVVIGRHQLGHITLVDVDPVQQSIERGAEVEASPAPVADLIDPEGFFLEMSGVCRLKKTEAFHMPCGHAVAVTLCEPSIGSLNREE